MIPFFDANCAIGRSRKAYPFSVMETADIKKELQRCNITKAVCHHLIAQEYDALEGNRILADEIREDDFFCPAYVMMPNHAEDFQTLEQFYAELKKNDVRLVKMFPAEHNFSPATWNMAECFHFLSDIHMPLMVSFKNININELHQILSDFPKLSVIVCDANYIMDRSLMSLMKQFENLLMETSSYATLDGIEYVTAKFGAGRLIFGSGTPLFAPGAAISKILYAQINDADKEQIAHGNLETLMEKVVLE